MKNKSERLKLKRAVLRELKKLQANSLIRSLSLIGSHVDSFKDLDSINDFDLLILLNSPLNPENYSLIYRSLQEIGKKFESDEVHFSVETIHGNIKPAPKKKFNIQLHQLTFYYNDFSSSLKKGNLALHNWVLMAKTLFGVPLKEDFPLTSLSKEQLFSERDSVDFFISLFKTNQNQGSKYVIKAKKLVKEKISLPLSVEDQLELFFIAINETLGNFLKYSSGKNEIPSVKAREDFLVRSLGEKKYLEAYRTLRKIKSSLRNLEKIDFDFSSLKEITLEILGKLKIISNKQSCSSRDKERNKHQSK